MGQSYDSNLCLHSKEPEPPPRIAVCRCHRWAALTLYTQPRQSQMNSDSCLCFIPQHYISQTLYAKSLAVDCRQTRKPSSDRHHCHYWATLPLRNSSGGDERHGHHTNPDYCHHRRSNLDHHNQLDLEDLGLKFVQNSARGPVCPSRHPHSHHVDAARIIPVTLIEGP